MIPTAFQADPVPDKRASRSIIRGINAMQKGSSPGGQGPGGLRLVLHCRLDGLGTQSGPPVSSEVSVKITLSVPSKGQGYWA